METNRERWLKSYTANLERAVVDHPDEYPWPVENVQAVAAKMTDRLASGGANKEGRAIRWTRKELGVPYTYAGISGFLNS